MSGFSDDRLSPRDAAMTITLPGSRYGAMLARRDIDTGPCPALHVIAGRALTGDGQPRHALGVDGRCRHCHTTKRGDTK
ncbi:hypothetical protein FDH07_gp42 [Propionibacterium phage Anatole]|uniref:Uncharacterized protein n=2 Tax=Anatolevirus anatole TaxID=2169704 RepID=A0A1D8ETF7_9CAUD|nr:hypothetical protein FDH07_gp42 [Propionibacterium phage Anatole]AOT24280.1 hypothetical protein ANATOLE_42 [Propionibacterium phage Anatole]AOT24516.1 hypothetical protein E1_42 [Propionibacterium phage E1]